MPTYASDTKVSSAQSRQEIERTLERYGADQFMYGWEEERAMVGFRASGRQVRFMLTMPDRNNRDFTHHSRGARTAEAAAKQFEQAVKQRWRALALVVKAKLEAVEAGITTFDEEFMAHIILPNGQTTADFMVPQIQRAYETGQMPPLLPAPGA